MPKVTVKKTGAKLANQIPFALALTLTQTAKDAQSEVVSNLESTFTLRGNWYKQSNKFGIKIQAATKRDLRSQVGTDADWLKLHEDGGTKTPAKHRQLAIPTTEVRRTKRQIIQRSQRPAALRGKRDFIIQTQSGPVLFVRKGRGRRSKIVPLYSLEPKAAIKKQSVLLEPTKKAVAEKLMANFIAALQKAYATAK